MDNDNDDERTSPWGLFNQAHSYVASAYTLETTKYEATHKRHCVEYLYYHAIELYLKSYLRACGLSVDELTKKYGHKTKKIANRAKREGLVLRDQETALVRFMEKSGYVLELRYIVTGYKQGIPTVDVLRDTCKYLHDTIGPKAYEVAPVTRRPVFPSS